ncbi:hypothetical protein QQP08_019409 [Theobroma cacao]|nr:hypothetical protein QQP08_019409 [Theobroma cacao]
MKRCFGNLHLVGNHSTFTIYQIPSYQPGPSFPCEKLNVSVEGFAYFLTIERELLQLHMKWPWFWTNSRTQNGLQSLRQEVDAKRVEIRPSSVLKYICKKLLSTFTKKMGEFWVGFCLILHFDFGAIVFCIDFFGQIVPFRVVLRIVTAGFCPC